MKKITLLFFAIIMANLLSFGADFTVTGNFNDWNNSAAEYKMTEIGTSGVYSLEKTLSAGTYEYKVFNTGTWTGPDEKDGIDNRIFTLTAETAVTFYAKLNEGLILFFCDAQQLYVIGSIVGGWTTTEFKAMTNSTTETIYTADVIGGNFKIVSLDKNGAIVWSDITPADQAISGTGNYTIKLDYTTFTVTATKNSEISSIATLGNSLIYIGQDPDPASAQWYNGSSTVQTTNFNAKDLGSVTTPIYIGAEITTTPVLNGVSAKMYYQIDDLTIKEIILPLNSSDGTTSSKWKSTTGVNVFTGYSLTKAQTYSLKVWFSATDGTNTLWDSNNSANYIATFTYDLGTGNNENYKNSTSVYSINNSIEARFDGKAQVKLFAINGQLIYSANLENEFSFIVNSGAYLVNINDKTHKVIVR
ncbi:MAG: hypothetical protein PHS59_06685 [Paludibacter sp.]|nr:hypothetical protein [Paludibacter sp.]